MKTAKKADSTPFLARECEGWIAPRPVTGAGKEKLQKYLLRFVTESEAIGVTRLTVGFIDDLSINTTERATSFLLQMRLKSNIKFRSFDSPANLASALRADSLAEDNFTDFETEFVYLCMSPAAGVTKRIEQLKEFAPGEEKKKGKKRQNKSEFHRLDAVFRHLRNAFAHGQFKRYTRTNGEIYWALQDSNSRGRVTARFLVKEDTLDSWMKLLINRDKRYR